MRMLRSISLLTLCLNATAIVACAQEKAPAATPSTAVEEVRQLAQDVKAAEQRVQDSQKELADLKARLAALEAELAGGSQPAAKPPQAATAPAESTSETNAVQNSEIATLNQIKVETDSKFPLKISGMLLLTASGNSGGVDSPVDPTVSLGGPGSTALSLRQTILGFDASGPHLAGAASSADLRVDFYGASATGAYASAGGLIRLRTAHAALDWPHAQLFFALDRTLLNPNTPNSLVQVAEPGLSWSGNLWNWMPQLGATARFGQSHVLVLQGAWVSPPDAPFPAYTSSSTGTDSPTLAEAARVPSGEVRIAFESGDPVRGLRLGVGGYISPHTLKGVGTFNAWAATLDLRAPLGRYMDLTGSLYRGAGLGGLGAGGYKDWVSSASGSTFDLHAPEDVGGWSQLAVHLNRSLDWNNAFGVDNVFGQQLRAYSVTTGGYANIARNRTITSNLIWSPRPYLPFSFEYRRLYTAPVTGRIWNANIFAFGAGYRF